MASGRNHHSGTIALTGAFLSVFLQGWQDAYLFAAIGSFATLAIYPDLDVDAGNIGLNTIDATNGIIGRIWRAYWRPYALIMHHRSFWSHAPIISTLIRALYCLPWWGGIIIIIHWSGYLWGRELAFVILGAICSDILHWLMDLPGISIFLAR